MRKKIYDCELLDNKGLIIKSFTEESESIQNLMIDLSMREKKRGYWRITDHINVLVDEYSRRGEI